MTRAEHSVNIIKLNKNNKLEGRLYLMFKYFIFEYPIFLNIFHFKQTCNEI